MPDKMLDRYVYLDIDLRESLQDTMTIHVKMDDEGIVVDAWQEDQVVASTWKTYDEMGVVVKRALDQEISSDKKVKVNGSIHRDCSGLHHDD